MMKSPIWEQVSVLSQKVFNRRRSLLFPMLLLALGLHAALLALPLPSSEGQKTPDDKKNPIKITQIPTENLDANPSSKAIGTTPKVAIPSMGKIAVADSSTADSSAADSSTTDSSTSSSATDSATDSSSGTASTSATSSTVARQAKKSSPASRSDTGSSDTSSSDTSNSKPDNSKPDNSNSDSSTAGSSAVSSPTTGTASIMEPSVTSPSPDATTSSTAPAVITASGNAATEASPFINFPHYQPSVSDCYSLGFGENCRVVSNVAIAEVINFFRKELAAKEFQTNLVTDEPTHKVLKVSRANKTMFLNIWQAKKDVAYLLAGVVYKQSPEEIKTEAGK